MTGHLYPLFVLAPVCGLLVDSVLHVIVSRMLRGRQIPSLAVAFLLGGLVSCLLTVQALKCSMFNSVEYWSCQMGNCLFYAALGFCYFNFVNLHIASLRIRILLELLSAGSEGLDVKAVLSKYNARDIINRRLERLCIGRQLLERNQRYYVGNRLFLLIARCNVLAKQLIQGGRYRKL